MLCKSVTIIQAELYLPVILDNNFSKICLENGKTKPYD